MYPGVNFPKFSSIPRTACGVALACLRCEVHCSIELFGPERPGQGEPCMSEFGSIIGSAKRKRTREQLERLVAPPLTKPKFP